MSWKESYVGIAYLSVYVVAVWVLLVISFTRGTHWVYRLLWLVYAISATVCLLNVLFQEQLVGRGIMQDMWFDLSNTTWWSYGLLVLCCIIAFRPLTSFDQYSKFERFGIGGRQRQIVVVFAYTYVIVVALYIGLSWGNIVSGLNVADFGDLRMATFANADNESTASMSDNVFGSLFFRVSYQLRCLAMFLAFSLMRRKGRRLIAFLLAGSSSFIVYISSQITAARGGLIVYAICVLLIGMYSLRGIQKVTKKWIYISGGASLFVVFTFFARVTEERFGEEGSSGEIIRNIFFYMGHAPIEFSTITGSLNHLAWGEVIVGRIMNLYTGASYDWQQIQTDIGYPPIGPVFNTYLGYLYTDFGVVGCIAFVLVWARYMDHLLKVRQNYMSTLFLLGYYLHFFVTGLFAVGRLEFASVITAFGVHMGLRLLEMICDWGKDDSIEESRIWKKNPVCVTQ